MFDSVCCLHTNMSENVITMHEESARTLFSDSGPLFHAFTSQKYDAEQVVKGLYASMRSKAQSLSIEDLENGLFLLGKDLRKMKSRPTFSLQPFLEVHPLISLRQSSISPKSSALVDLRLNRLIREEPASVHLYRWTLKAFEYVADLSLFWGLISPDQYAYRERIAGSMVFCM